MEKWMDVLVVKKEPKEIKRAKKCSESDKDICKPKKNVRFAISDVCDRQTLRHNRVIFEFVFILTGVRSNPTIQPPLKLYFLIPEKSWTTYPICKPIPQTKIKKKDTVPMPKETTATKEN